MPRKAALIAGIVFVLIGIAGFIPGITAENNGARELFGIFRTNAVHNIVHIVSGLVFLAVANSAIAARLVFQIMGVIYALITIIGFIIGSGGSVLGLFLVNPADDILYLIITLIFLYFGFGRSEQRKTDATVT